MAAKRRAVVFARINRRAAPSLVMRPFRDEMQAMVDAHTMRAEHNHKIWIAGDLTVTDDGYLVGIIGYETTEMRTGFDEEAWSWRKGPQSIAEGASQHTLAPFAVNLDQARRWVAFVSVGHLTSVSFPGGFQAVLQRALREQDAPFPDWEVDVLSSGVAFREWIDAVAGVHELRLVFRRPNPKPIRTDVERQQMRQLNAVLEERLFRAAPRDHLNMDEETDAIVDGMREGDLAVKAIAVGGETYNSERRPEQQLIEDFGEDLQLGMDDVLDLLREFSSSHSPPDRTGDPADE